MCIFDVSDAIFYTYKMVLFILCNIKKKMFFRLLNTQFVRNTFDNNQIIHKKPKELPKK